jgi:hypothetical protein
MSEAHQHNLSVFLLSVARLLDPNGCRTVEELLATGAFAREGGGEFDIDRLMSTGKALLADLRSLDYVALRNLAAAVDDPWVLLDIESLLGPELR